jgi:hypothetical protein
MAMLTLGAAEAQTLHPPQQPAGQGIRVDCPATERLLEWLRTASPCRRRSLPQTGISITCRRIFANPGRQRADRSLPDGTGISLTRKPGPGISKKLDITRAQGQPGSVRDRHRSCDPGEHQSCAIDVKQADSPTRRRPSLGYLNDCGNSSPYWPSRGPEDGPCLPKLMSIGLWVRLDVYWPLGQLDCERVRADIVLHAEHPP